MTSARSPVPLLALAALLLVAIAPTAAAATVSQPRWELGDEWTYAISLVQDGAVVQTGDRHVVVTARGPFSYHGASREAITISTWGNMSGDPAFSFVDIRDASTGALLATQSGGDTLTTVAPCHEIQYPLTFPKSWAVSCDLGFGPVDTFYTVAGAETITLPAGTFETLSVDAVGDDAVRYWFSEKGCGKVAEFSQTNDLATYVNLTAAKCLQAGAPTPTPTVSPATPTRTTPVTTPTVTPSAAPSTYDYGCPPGTSHDDGGCLTSDADGDGSPLGLERSRGTDPNDPDTDGDGVRDNDDKAPLTAGGAEDNRTSTNATGTSGAPGVGVGALLLALALVALRRKPS